MDYVYRIYAIIDGENGSSETLVDTCETSQVAIRIAKDYDEKVARYNEANGYKCDTSYSQIRFEKQ